MSVVARKLKKKVSIAGKSFYEEKFIIQYIFNLFSTFFLLEYGFVTFRLEMQWTEKYFILVVNVIQPSLVVYNNKAETFSQVILEVYICLLVLYLKENTVTLDPIKYFSCFKRTFH